jgi:hypothetical protein
MQNDARAGTPRAAPNRNHLMRGDMAIDTIPAGARPANPTLAPRVPAGPDSLAACSSRREVVGLLALAPAVAAIPTLGSAAAVSELEMLITRRNGAERALMAVFNPKDGSPEEVRFLRAVDRAATFRLDPCATRCSGLAAVPRSPRRWPDAATATCREHGPGRLPASSDNATTPTADRAAGERDHRWAGRDGRRQRSRTGR